MVTPFVGVWIETFVISWPEVKEPSHPSWVCGLKLLNQTIISFWFSHTLRGCVDWNTISIEPRFTTRRHTLRGCVDWNTVPDHWFTKIGCHTLRGCVDWNQIKKSSPWRTKVTPFVGVWIETPLCFHVRCVLLCHTLRGCVDWNSKIPSMARTYKKSHPSWVCGLKLLNNSSFH